MHGRGWLKPFEERHGLQIKELDMNFIHSTTHEEADEGLIRSRFITRHFSTPMTIAEALEVGYEPITEIASGATEFQDAVRTSPVKTNGQWTKGWALTNKPVASIALLFEGSVQAHLDASAVAKGYDNALSACSYAGAANPYQAYGQAFVAWRGSVWAQCYADLTAIQAGTKQMPISVASYIATLPAAPV